MDRLTSTLKALAHPERLRLLALIAEGDLTVSELTDITELSQPRVTQYIKTLADAGVVERLKEGSWVFSRLRRGEAGVSAVVASTLAALPEDEQMRSDRQRLAELRARRAIAAQVFFADVANDRGQLGDEFLPQADIDRLMLDMVGETVRSHVDLGTGSARVLTLFADRVERGRGLDSSHDMLRLARHRLHEAGAEHLSVRQGDIFDAPLDNGSADLVTLHQVLHYLEEPELAVAEAGRLLEEGGRLLVVDFAEHGREEFRRDFNHRRMGFSDRDMTTAFALAGLAVERVETVSGAGRPDVKLWLGRKSSAERRQA